MTDQRLGAAFRAVRIRRGWRQRDVAEKARVSRGSVSDIERGRLDSVTIRVLRAIATALDIRVDLVARWRGSELDRLLDAKHAALQNAVTRWLEQLGGWLVVPEVSFSISGERGSIDLLAWHAATRTLLVIEIKTAIVDLQDLLATFDRKARLAPRIARERGWQPAVVARWLVIADGSTNRRRVAAHSATLRAALPADGAAVRRWLVSPAGGLSALSFLSTATVGGTKQDFVSRQRVRRPRARRAEQARTVALDGRR